MNGRGDRRSPLHVAIQADRSFAGDFDAQKILSYANALIEETDASHITICYESESPTPALNKLLSPYARSLELAIRIWQSEQIEPVSTSHGPILTLAENYAARQEILNAIKTLVRERVENNLHEPITQDQIQQELAIPDLPYPDLIIRTGSNHQLPDNLIWQMAYSEFWSTPTPWSELTESELRSAIDAFHGRERRFGKVPVQASQ